MNKFCLLLAGLSIFCQAQGQTVTSKKQSEKIRNENAEGYTTTLDGKRDEVTSAWSKYLKEIGKSRSSGDMFTITEPALGATVYEKGILYATATGTDQKTTVWIGLLPTEWTVNDIELVYKELDQLVYRFGVKYYRDKIQLQIDEAQQASDAVDRQAQRLLNENKNLNASLVKNEKQKVELEKSLEENKLEHLVLLQRIENNKKAQDSIAQTSVKVKKVVDMHKERQRKVN